MMPRVKKCYLSMSKLYLTNYTSLQFVGINCDHVLGCAGRSWHEKIRDEAREEIDHDIALVVVSPWTPHSRSILTPPVKGVHSTKQQNSSSALQQRAMLRSAPKIQLCFTYE
jgi:hypothetical protein